MKTNAPVILKPTLRGAVFAAGLALVCGCANLEAVRNFSKTSAATADYQQIISDYAEFPARDRRYKPESSAARLDALAKQRAEQKKKLEGAQTVLVQYMSALGDLAADKIPNVDSEIDGLGKSLEQAKFIGDGDAAISKETGAAAGTIAKILIRAALDHWRQRQVVKIVQDADPSVQIVVAGLHEIVSKDFTLSLDAEAEDVDAFFQESLAASRSLPDPEAVVPLVQILRQEHMDRIEARRSKVKAYAQVLEKIGKGHADLCQNVGKITDKDLQTRLKQYSKDLQVLYKAIQTLSH